LGEGRKQTCGGGQISNKRPYSRANLNEGLEGEWKHNYINNQKNSCEIKNGYYPIFPLFVLEGDLWELGETKGRIINKNKVHLVLKIDLHTSGTR
jgi:hypothetical protein